jgi:hypothetical protein
MKKIAMVSVAAVATLAVQLGGIGSAFAAEPDAADGKAPVTAKGSASPQSVQNYACEQSGIGTSSATATCKNTTGQARSAHFHVDCWAWADSDTDQTKWVGPYGSVSFYHGCWSHAQGIEAYYY